MAATEPTYYYIKAMSGQGMDQGDIHRAIYNLYKAVYAICYNLDDEGGTLGTDYLSAIGTDLATAMASLKTPKAVQLDFQIGVHAPIIACEAHGIFAGKNTSKNCKRLFKPGTANPCVGKRGGEALAQFVKVRLERTQSSARRRRISVSKWLPCAEGGLVRSPLLGSPHRNGERENIGPNKSGVFLL